MKKISIKESIYKSNDEKADGVRKVLDSHGIFALNIMASPGAGKTSIIEETIRLLKNRYRIIVIDGDIVRIDVERISQLGVPVVLANTGGACHLDAVMVEKAIQKIPLHDCDLLIVENVGNLICPSHFQLGVHANVVISSVPEGDDKPYKYPTVFKGSDVVIINKVDYLDFEEFDIEYFKKGVDMVNDSTKFFPVSCRTKEGLEQWKNWLESKLRLKKV